MVAHGGRVDERVDVLAGQTHAIDARVGRRVLHVRGWRVRVGHVGHLAEVLRLGGRTAHPIQPRAGLEGRVTQIRPRAPVRQGRGVLGPSCNETQTGGVVDRVALERPLVAMGHRQRGTRTKLQKDTDRGVVDRVVLERPVVAMGHRWGGGGGGGGGGVFGASCKETQTMGL